MSHWQSLTKVSRADKLFSEYIRQRDGRCKYKVRCFGTPVDWKSLDCSHYIGRVKRSTRFDPLNCDAACKSCHNFVHTAAGQQWLDEWKLKQLGEQGFALLLLRSRTIQKKDDILELMYVKELLKELK